MTSVLKLSLSLSVVSSLFVGDAAEGVDVVDDADDAADADADAVDVVDDDGMCEAAR